MTSSTVQSVTLLLTAISLLVILGGVVVAWRQLRTTASSIKLSALAQLSAGQRSISETMLNCEEFLPIFYGSTSKENARKLIFLTLLINNFDLAYQQIKLGLADNKVREALTRHLQKEFKNTELRERLINTKDAYDPSFVSFVLDP